MSGAGFVRVLLALLLLARLTPEAGALVCLSEADAFALVMAEIQQNALARFQFRGFERAALLDVVTSRLHLIQSIGDTNAALASDTTVDDNAFAYQWSAARLRHREPLTYPGAGDPSDEAVNCSALAAPLAEYPPPAPVLDVVNALVYDSILFALESQCLESEVQTWNAATQTYTCQCAEGFVCVSETTDETLLLAAAWILIGGAALVALVVLAYTAALAWTMHRHERRQLQYAELAETHLAQ